MSKSKDKVINEMRKIAICNPKRVNIVSLLALAASLNHLQALENPNLFHDFIQIICQPANFSLSYEQLADVCHYNEKAQRRHCKHFKQNAFMQYIIQKKQGGQVKTCPPCFAEKGRNNKVTVIDIKNAEPAAQSSYLSPAAAKRHAEDII